MASGPVLRTIQAVLQREMVRNFLGEFMSTYIMMVFGLGSVAHMVLGDQKLGSYLGVNLGFGFGVTMGVHVAGGISGAHMNAAVTFTNCALGRMPWKKFPVYVLGQFLGSFSAAATTYLLFYGAIDHFAHGVLLVTGPRATANIFATYLPEHMTLWRGFLDEVFLTGLLQLCIFAITDKNNSPALQGTEALVIGILVCVIGISLGMNSGYAINPSRDLPPRFFTFIAGWGIPVFRPPSLCLQCRGQLVVGACGGTHPGSLHRWHCVRGLNSLQYTAGSSETGEFCSRRWEDNRVPQRSPQPCLFYPSFCPAWPTPKWLFASRALLSGAYL
ncbi:aquaporin-7 isoform X3 [Psammomys obesus]|uniref:aquaporin-7 isoform X3 n=1 Tax=Psammomys obesus TaxID=48139 RepID=UPI0024533897|nr:aquaporin-7 isoform X3 [Psammomys obesus]